MTIPLLEYAPKTQNQRVAGYEVPGDEQAKIYSLETLPSGEELDRLIQSAYRQIYNEQQVIASNRQTGLESQLRFGQITVREFVRGLALSENFRTRNYDCSNNYRFAQMCVQRFLGRDVYDDREKLAWSIVIATKGLKGFIDALIDSDEYLDNFGDNTVPYQRRRIIPQRTLGDVTFAHMPRYGADHRAQLEAMGYFEHKEPITPLPPFVEKLWIAIALAGGGVLAAGVVAIALAAWGIITL
ncbi:MAG: phycobilisome rod-core linker polypeptide [Cyanobacteria bacterium SBLK]|nr:phycobilisome rod-core linker polypeptide [Cyanobacteria bacterium SBLK]